MNINKKDKKITFYCPVCDNNNIGIIYKNIDYIPLIKKEIKFTFIECKICKTKFPIEILSKKITKLLSKKFKINVIKILNNINCEINTKEKNIKYFYYMLTGEKITKKEIQSNNDTNLIDILKSMRKDLTLKEKARLLKILIIFLRFINSVNSEQILLNIGYHLDIHPKLYANIKFKNK